MGWVNNLPNRISRNDFHLIALIGSKWSWGLCFPGKTQEMSRSRIESEPSWLEARRVFAKAITESQGPVQLCLARQFNWPTGISAGQPVRLGISIETKVTCHASLDGDCLELREDREFLLSDPILADTEGARRLELMLEFGARDTLPERNPLFGVWLRIG